SQFQQLQHFKAQILEILKRHTNIEMTNPKNRLRKRPLLINADLKFKRSEVRHSQMILDTLRSVAEKLEIDTTGSKTDLINRITTHCPKRRNPQEEESTTQTQMQADEMDLDTSSVNTFLDEDQDLKSTKASTSSSDIEILEPKKAHQMQVKASDIKSLLTEIKELRKDMISINTRVEETQTKAKIEEEWPEEWFERSRDQHEAVIYIKTVKKKVKDRMITLKVAKRYGWDVAVELPQPTEEELTNYAEVINRARQAARIKFWKKRLLMNQPEIMIQTDIMTQKTITTQDHIIENENQSLMMKNSNVITVVNMGSSRLGAPHQDTTDLVGKDSDRMTQPSLISYILRNENKSLTIDNRLVEKWYLFISQRATPFSSTTDAKTVQYEYRTSQLNKGEAGSDGEEWGNKMAKYRTNKTTDTHG
ncbi:11199_t:CDS:2, partial [Cetraspora pellucida]